jgi:hypothetical protein
MHPPGYGFGRNPSRIDTLSDVGHRRERSDVEESADRSSSRSTALDDGSGGETAAVGRTGAAAHGLRYAAAALGAATRRWHSMLATPDMKSRSGPESAG